MKRIVGVEWATLLANPNDPAWKRIPMLGMLGADPLLAHVEILMQVCKALAYAHGRGVLHRDVKPQNVMIGELGEVYLVDWGVATLLDAAEVRQGIVGTPCFSAPEMIDNALSLGAWTDVYLLGATLHFVLTGRPRHEGTLLRQVVMAAYESRPVAYPASVPEELADLCNRATAREPSERPSSAMAFHRELAAFVAHTGSLSLAAAADERFGELERLLAPPEQDLTRASRVAAECRFTHLLALRDWAQNPRAKAGLQRCLERMIEMEIARENAVAARALLVELIESAAGAKHSADDVASRLETTVRELESRHAERLRKEEELRMLQHEGDLSVASRQRLIFLLGMMGVVGLGTVSLLRPGKDFADQIPTAPALFQIALGAFVLAALGVALGRRHLLKNAANRGFVAVFLGALLVMAVHRGLAVVAGMPVRDMLRTDLLLAATAVWSTAVLVRRVWIVGAAVMLAGAVASTFVPFATAALFPICTFALFAIIGLGWRQPSVSSTLGDR
jgi:serine/threonine-protein kinase